MKTNQELERSITELIYEKLLLFYISGNNPMYQIKCEEKHYEKLYSSLNILFIANNEGQRVFPLKKIKYEYSHRYDIIYKINEELKYVYSLIAPTTYRYINICKECYSVYMGRSTKKYKTKICDSCLHTEIKKETIKKVQNNFVYLMKSELTGLLKIGISIDPVKRRRTLETAQGGRIELLKIISGGRNIERKLHDKFSNYRKDGEWFEYSSEILDYFEV